MSQLQPLLNLLRWLPIAEAGEEETQKIQSPGGRRRYFLNAAFLGTALTLSVWGMVVAAENVAAPVIYSNPVLAATLADPAVISYRGVYYLYATGDVDGDNGYRAYTSTDLVHWERGPVVFRPG